MLASGQVFGARSGRHAAQYAQSQGVSNVPPDVTGQAQERIARLKSQRGSISVRKVKHEIQQRMWEDMLVVRTPEGFDRVLQMAAHIRQESLPKVSVEGPLGLVEALEIDNMLTVAEISTRAALTRTESRGGHNRMDHPERDDANWLHSIAVKKENGIMKLDKLAFDPGWTDREGDMGHARWG
jgi:succinate dehydrogenase / fumarate reductase flavoprotein subunit